MTTPTTWPTTPSTPPAGARLVADIVDVDLAVGPSVRRGVPHDAFDELRRHGGIAWHDEPPAVGLMGDNPMLQFVDSPGFWVVTSHDLVCRGRPRPGAVLVRARRHVHAVAGRGQPADVPPDDAEHGPPAAHPAAADPAADLHARSRSSGCAASIEENATEILDGRAGRVRPRDGGLGRDAAAGARRPLRHAARGPPPDLRLEQRAARGRQPGRGPARRATRWTRSPG